MTPDRMKAIRTLLGDRTQRWDVGQGEVLNAADELLEAYEAIADGSAVREAPAREREAVQRAGDAEQRAHAADFVARRAVEQRDEWKRQGEENWPLREMLREAQAANAILGRTIETIRDDHAREVRDFAEHETHWMRVRFALRLSVLEAERDAALYRSRPELDPSQSCKVSVGGFCARRDDGCTGDPCLHRVSPLRIATPADLPEIRANMVPSQAKVIAKLAAESIDYEAIGRAASNAALRKIRDDFQQRWGRFWICPARGCGARIGESRHRCGRCPDWQNPNREHYPATNDVEPIEKTYTPPPVTS